MARPKKLTEAEKMRDVEAYTHDDKKRTNNPPVGMAQHDKAEEKIKPISLTHILTPRSNGRVKPRAPVLRCPHPLSIFTSPSSHTALFLML